MRELDTEGVVPLIIISMAYIALIIWFSTCLCRIIPSAHIEYIFTLSLIPLILIIAAAWRYKVRVKLSGGEIYFSPVETVMEEPYTIDEEKTGKDAEEMMERKGIDFLNIVDRNGRFKGIFTRADAYMARRRRKIGTRLKNIMIPKERVVSSSKGERVIDVIHKIGESKHSRIPVLDGEKIVGVVDSVIIHRILSKSFKSKK